jgi:hypothetical protein
MPRRAPRRDTGRRSILTTQLADDVVALVEAGNYITTAAAAVGVSDRTIYDWIAQGEDATAAAERGEQLPARALVFARFAQGIARARARAEVSAVGVVEQVMAGGHLVEETPIVTPDGKLARDDAGEILYRRKYAPPNGELALKYLASAFPLRWRPNVQRLEVTGADGAPVRVETDRADDLAARLTAHVQRREQEALESGDVEDAEIVEES